MNADKEMKVGSEPAGIRDSTTVTEVGLLHADITDRVIAAFYDVYNELGFGFLESVYKNAMIVALRQKGLEVETETPIAVMFRGAKVGNFFADLLINRCVILELKTANSIEKVHEAQLLNYLRATDIEVGLVLNFGPKPQFRRLRLDNARKAHSVHA